MSQTPKHPPAPPKAPAGDPKTLIDDDVLHVPRGVSRGTFIFLVGLLIFLMVIWLVPGAMLGIAGGAGNPVVMRLTLPSGGKLEWKATDVQWRTSSILDALSIDVFLGYSLGLDPSKPEPDDLTRVLALDAIAQDAGVMITDEDLREHLTEILQFQRATAEDFQLGVRQRGLDQRTMEETIRMLLRVARFQQLVGFAGAMPDPKEIEKLWHQENAEYAFDYVALASASLREEALKELPDDAGLEAWFAKLEEGEKAALRTEETRSAEVALFRDSETTPAAELVAAYPEIVVEGAAPTTPDELATRYYNRVYHVRFRKGAEEGAEAVVPGYLSQEEVQAQCLAEAPIYFALQRWIEVLAARKTAGETIDLAAEAEKLGLDHQAYLDAQPRSAFVADTALGHEELANAVFETPADGSFYPSPTPLPQGLCVVRVNGRTEPALPAFAAIRDRVVELWVTPKTQELAEKKLVALRDSFERFEPTPPAEGAPPRVKTPKEHRRAAAEAFLTAVKGAGLEVERRDWLNKAGPATKDPQHEDEEHRTLFAQARAFGLYDLEADEVAEVGLSYDKETAYLVRLAGKREVPLDDMSPVQYDRYKQTTRANQIRDISKRFDLEYLKRQHGLWLLAEEEALKREGSGDS
jgi:hypothetical protein